MANLALATAMNPGDPEGFWRSLLMRTPTIYNAIRHAKPLANRAPRLSRSVLRYWERRDVPARFANRRRNLPIQSRLWPRHERRRAGVCLLSRLLRGAEKRDPIAGLAPAFFAEVPALLETPWAVATSDFIHPSTRGQRPADFETRIRFGIALTRLAAENPALHRLTAEVFN
jgi:hypothetical protein